MVRIRPFPTRPAIEMDYLFYAVPWTNPGLLETCFTDRFWDHREHWIPPGIGTVPGSERRWSGAIPGPEVSELSDGPAVFTEGVDYDRWISGGYSGFCFRTYPDSVGISLESTSELGCITPSDETGLAWHQYLAPYAP